MKKSLLWLVLVLFLILSAVIIIALKIIPVGHISTDNVNITPAPQLTLTHYFIPVVTFKDFRQDITLAELQKAKLCGLKSDKAYLDQLAVNKLGGNQITYIDKSSLTSTLQSGIVCLLQPADLDMTYKSITVEGQDFWAKETDLSKYPLQISETDAATSQLQTESDNIAYYTTAANRSRIFVSGEIIPARAVDRLELNRINNYTYLFDDFRQDISSADIAIAMLENDLSGNPTPCTGCMVFVGDQQNAAGFKTVGYDMMSFGNHAGDGGQAGYKNTISAFDAVGLLHTGIGLGDAAKLTPAIMTVNGERIGLVGADAVQASYWNKGSTTAFGTNWFSLKANSGIDMTRVNELASIKAEYHIDYLIVYMSWGIEYTDTPTQFQKDLAHAFIDYGGVDMVLGSHPHWVQSMEFYKGKPIFYALGNFIFDQNNTVPTREAVVLNLYYIGGVLKSIDIIPHLTCGPFVSKVDLTDKYLAGQIDMNYLNTHDETQGCVYFQPRKILPSDKFYQEVYNRMMKSSIVN